MSQNSLRTDLERLIEGEVTEAPAAITEASVDYGGVVSRVPLVVVRPQTANDAARVVQYAYARDLPLTARAGGFSFAGQSLSEGGIVLDMKRLRAVGSVQLEGEWIEAEAGAQWNHVAEATLRDGFLPPVLTSYLGTSVGGTLSAAGVGFSSFRYGAQVDNVLALDLVHYTGEIVRCSQEENSELFEHALCGFGQFGVIYRARLRVRAVPPCVRTYFLQYDDLSAHLADQEKLSGNERVHSIEGIARPCCHGKRAVDGGRAPFYSYLYPLNFTVEGASPEDFDDEQLLSGLNFSRWVYVEDLGLTDYVLLGHAEDTAFSPKVSQVFVDVILPWSAAETFVRRAEAHIFPRFLQLEHIRFAAIKPAAHVRPLLRFPGEPLTLGMGLYSRVPKSYAQQNLLMAKAFIELAQRSHGAYYLPGSVRLDEPELARHFGQEWAAIQEAKRRHDPKGLFNPGFFPWPNP